MRLDVILVQLVPRFATILITLCTTSHPGGKPSLSKIDDHKNCSIVNLVSTTLQYYLTEIIYIKNFGNPPFDC